MGFKKTNIYLYCLSKSIWIDSIGRLQSKNTPKPCILVIFGLVYGMCMPKYEKILKHAELLDYRDMGKWAFWLFMAYLGGSIETRQGRPVDPLPTSSTTWSIKKNIYFNFFYIWQVTRDRWHVTGDTWYMMNLLSKLQLPSSSALGLTVFGRYLN